MSESSVRNNLAFRLLGNATRNPDAPALIYGAETVSYQALAARVDDRASTLRGVGAARESRVALLFPNTPLFVEALLAVIYCGAVAVPLNTRGSLNAQEQVIGDSLPKVLIAHESLAEHAESLAQSQNIILIIARESQGWAIAQAAGQQAEAPHFAGSASGDVTAGPSPVRPADICMQPYTSGSTGPPKGCLLTHGGQIWNAETVKEVWELDSSDRGLVTAPIYHKNAMICVVKPMLLAGGTIVIGESSNPKEIAYEVERHRCTYTTGVPSTYQLLLDAPDLHERDISSLNFVVCGSAALSESLGARIMRNLGAPVIEAYGLTEGGPQVLMSPLTNNPRFGSVGKVIPGCEVKLLAATTMPGDSIGELEEVPLGSDGEIWVKSPGVTVGYYNRPDETASKISPDGWLRTGDIANKDAEGWFRISGRYDDMMVVGGENVYPNEVEALITSIPGVKQAAVVPVPEEVKGQVPVAFVIADGLTEEQVKEHSLSQGAAYAHPRRVWFEPSLPISGTGKIDRRQLIDRAKELYADSEKGQRGENLN